MTVERFPIEKARPPAQPRDVALQHVACRALLRLGGRFSDERYAWVFHAIVHLYLAEREVDLITVSEELRGLGRFEMVGAEFVAALMDEGEP